jgi:WD40 repeat protein
LPAKEIGESPLFKKIASILAWIVFAIGVVALALMLWSNLQPSPSKQSLQKSIASEKPKNTIARGPASNVHPEFIQNLNNQLSNSQSTDRISSMAYDTKNDFFLIGHESGAVDIWDAKQANARREVKAHNMRTSRLNFSSDGRVFFSSSPFDDVTHVWDTASGALVHSIEGSRGPVVETSDPTLFIVGSDSGLRIFNLSTNQVLPGSYRQVGDSVTALAYDMPTDQLAIGTASGEVAIWKLLKAPELKLERVAVTHPYTVGNWVKAVQFFDSGRSVYSLPQRGNLDEWSLPRLEHLRSREISLGFVGASVFMPDRGRLAMAGYRKGDKDAAATFLEIFNLNDGQESLLDLQDRGTGALVYLPSLSSIVGSSHSSIVVIDVAKAK